jgi:hypothetical protein
MGRPWVVKTKGAALALPIAEPIKPAVKSGAIKAKILPILALLKLDVMT